MLKLILAGVLLLCGSLILTFAARSFKDIRLNLALVLTACLFMGQGTIMLSQVRVANSAVPAVSATQSNPPDASVASVQTNNSSTGQTAWDQGGTLQGSQLGAWRLGEYTNRLASAAALLKTLRQERLFTASIRSEQDYRPWAAALVACLEASLARDDTPVIGLARDCTRSDGLKPYLQ